MLGNRTPEITPQLEARDRVVIAAVRFVRATIDAMGVLEPVNEGPAPIKAIEDTGEFTLGQMIEKASEAISGQV